MSSGGGGRRRAAPSADADPLADILSKLGLGDEGSGSTVVEPKHTDHAVHVLMEVLQIDWDRAQFFLASSQNDVVKAVNLHFELSESGGNKRSRPTELSSFARERGIERRWVERPVEIEGLPEGWRAFVSRTQVS